MSELYKLPDGNVQISFSGGRTSGYMLHQILDANGDLPDRVRVIFSNTGREMPETLDFVQECGERWGVNIIWTEWRPEKPFFETVNHNCADRDGWVFSRLIAKNKMLPNVGKRFCTKEMKVLTAKRYLVSVGWKQWTNTLGIRADEPKRLRPSKDKRMTRWFPMAQADVRKSDVLDFWSTQPFDLRLTTTSNCEGCFLKSEANLAAMWRSHPERMQWWVDQEEKMQANFIYGKPYKKVGEFVDAQGDWIFDADNGALCQADDGECLDDL